MTRRAARLLAAAAVTELLGAAVLTAALSGLAAAAAPSSAAQGSIPTAYLHDYQAAAASCPGLSWTVLAGIGTVESDNGRSTLPGVHAGANAAGAQGPMQFEPATFARYALPVPPGGARPPSPYDPVDATAAAARYLCALGAPADLHDALVAYACGNPAPACQLAAAGYAGSVLADAARFGGGAAGQVGAPAQVAIAAAVSVLGTPYRWGGASPAGGFDCSGLVQWAYAQAGIALPRTAQEQYDATAPLPAGAPPAPGDLVFYGASLSAITHVGLYLGGGEMIDAPHTGALVRTEPYQWADYRGAGDPTLPADSAGAP